MIDAVESRVHIAPERERPAVEIFTEGWLVSFGAALVALYLIYFLYLYHAGTWIVSRSGAPVYTDFGNQWAAGWLAVHGRTAALADPAAFVAGQAALFPTAHAFYPNWPYPPSFLLLMAPLSLLPYGAAFILWDAATLAAGAVVVHRIVPHRAAAVLLLAAPFTIWNLLAAQNGLLTAALLGAALVALENRPLTAGILIGFLTYKPQFGVLVPLALAAAAQWRAFAAAALTALLLAGASFLLFGHELWPAFPHELVAQARLNLLAGESGNWGYLQTVYGFARLLHAGAAAAWTLQSIAAAAATAIVWWVWRSAVVYPLKAAVLSAAALVATPHAFAYDMAALAIPAAFLARDQLQRGLLPGDKMVWIGLFAAPLAVLVIFGDNAGGPTFGSQPVGLAAVLLLSAAIVRRLLAMPVRPVAGRPAGIVGAPR